MIAQVNPTSDVLTTWALLLGAALATVAALILLRSLLPSVWAVARHSIAEAVRMRLAVFFGVLMVLGFWAATQTKGDGTVTGRVQSFLAYSLTTVSLLLALLSIFLSRSLSHELVHRQILMLMTKPLARWQYVLGKWLGVALLNAAVLAVTGIGIYLTVTLYLARQPALNEYDAQRLDSEVLTARHASRFQVPDFAPQAARLYAQNEENGRYEMVENLNPAAVKEELRKELEIRWRAVPPGEQREFVFANVLCDRSADTWIQLRYKAEANRYPPDEILRSVWFIGDPAKSTAAYQTPRRDVGDRFHTMSIPGDAVAADGTLKVRFVNVNPFQDEQQFPNVFLFQGPQALEVLFEVGTFGGNLVRLLFLTQCKLMFLAAVALLFATVFSFPVASLCSIFVYAVAATRGFLGEAFDMLDAEGAVGWFREAFGYLLKGLYLLIPDFSAYSATDLLVDGRNVTLAWVLMGLTRLAIVATGAALLIACVLFHRREVSEVSV